MDILATVKMLLGINDTSQDALLSYHIQRVIDAILSYCNRDDLPEQLHTTVIDKVCNVYKSSTGGSSNEQVVSISRGNTTIQMNQQASSDTISIVSDIEPVLARWRKVRVI